MRQENSELRSEVKLLITIDTEGDNQWDAESRKDITTENAKYLPRFQSLCEKYGYKPTYLTNYEMAVDEFFVKFARECIKRGMCEIGSHPHAWNSPPDYSLTENDNKYTPYLFEYPEEIIYGKINFLTNLLESKCERKIVSHRAGRWGFNESYASILEQNGYKVDCSVTPFISWKSQRGAPTKNSGSDFRNFPKEAYLLDLNDISKVGDSTLLEIPMTIRKNYSPFLGRLYSVIPTVMGKRAIRYIFGQPYIWFRCDTRNTRDLLKMIENEIASGTDYLEFMLHSSEFMPGGSPIFTSQEDIDNLYKNLDHIFSLLSRRGVVSVTCEEYYDIFIKKHKLVSQSES